MTAEAFNEAANLLFNLQHRYAAKYAVKMFKDHQMFFVEAVRCIEAWMKKAVYHATCAEGPNGAKDTKINLQTVLQDSVCVMTKSVVSWCCNSIAWLR